MTISRFARSGNAHDTHSSCCKSPFDDLKRACLTSVVDGTTGYR